MMTIDRELVWRRGQLIIPKALLNRIYGNKRRRISIVITDPRSRHVILTRYPENYNAWYQTTIARDTDFIPTAVLEKAKIENNATFMAEIRDGEIKSHYGDLIVRRVN